MLEFIQSIDMNYVFPVSGAKANILLLAFTGFSVGVLGGFFGVGGVWIITPAMNILGFPMVYSIGSGMAYSVGSSGVSAAKHKKIKNVDVKLAMIIACFSLMALTLMTKFVTVLDREGSLGSWVRYVYIVLLLGLGSGILIESIKTILSEKPLGGFRSRMAEAIQKIKIPPMIHFREGGIGTISAWFVLLVALVLGSIKGFLGSGGGFILIPMFIYLLGVSTRAATGTSSLVILITSIWGTFLYSMEGMIEYWAVLVMLLPALLGSPLGAAATQYVIERKIRLYFGITLFLAAISIIFKQMGMELVAGIIVIGTAGSMALVIVGLYVYQKRRERLSCGTLEEELKKVKEAHRD